MFSVYNCKLGRTDKDLIFSINCIYFFFCRGINSGHVLGAGENHQVHAAPCTEGDFFFGRSVDSLLLSETSGHYNNKRAKDEVEGLFLKPSDSHH